MTLLPVDPAYAFDYLAILEVKSERGMDVENELQTVAKWLTAQHENMEEVTCSDEYVLLVRINASVFDAIEKAHKNAISAKEVQRINYKRFEAKQALQNKFWPQLALAEKKTSIAKKKVRR